ncbi:MAG TPA: hypothetical protein GXX25_01200, partial [Desulfotomaculum sp.]|nr:hypothetical protein [Desulfotomaculum sp.]
MPRINRIRLHNIRYDKGNRIFDNLILNLGGYNGLLLLHNGGGKTLLLQLIAQVVCPNVPLQGRRLAGLVQEVPFTGHVLVEWLLDGNRYWYLLTGFCFAENLGSAHRDIDYFTYLTEYGERNPWDLESFPLLGEDGRTLNYRQLRERLAASGSRVRTFASDRRREYQRELQSYMIDPWEWEQVLITNSSEGGVGKFFESCSKTPQLLERLLIPAFDGVLGRTADGNDSLTRAFQQAAEELMRLPELKANKGALEQLSQRLPRLAEALEQVREAGEQVEEAEGERCSLYATLERGIPRLDLAIRRLDAARERCRGRIQEIQFQMDSLVVEEKKREKERLQVDLEKATMRFNDVRRDYDRAEESYRRHKAWRYWGKYQDKTASLRQEEERKRQLMVGREQQEREIQSLREKVWPLYRALLHGWRQREQLEKDRLQELQRELQSIDREIGRREARLQECREKRANLLGLREGFVKLKDSVAREMGREGLAIPLEEPEPAKARVVAEKTLAEEALKHWKETAATGWREQDAVRKELEGLRTREGVLQQEIRETEQQYEAWRRDLLSLRETLALAGVVSPDPVADPAGLKAELARQIAHLEAGKVRLEVEKNRLEERRLLFSGAGGPLPNADVARLQAVLEEYGVKSVTGASWLQGLDSDARRQAWVTRFPWLPYALIAEGEQIVRLVERGVELKIDLSAAVPVAARGSLQLDGGEETQVYFFRNKGLEPFVYPARAAALIQEMEAQGEELSEQINRLGRDMESRRQAAAALQKWQEGHRYNREEEWELVLREKAGALEQLKKDLEAAAGRMAALSGELAAAQEQERRMEMRATRLGSLLERLAEYSAEWSLEMERCEQERHLLMEEAALAGEINNLARQRESLQEEQERLKEQARATASRIKEMEQDGVEMFPPGYAGAPVEDQLTTCPVTDPACLKEYTEMAG